MCFLFVWCPSPSSNLSDKHDKNGDGSMGGQNPSGGSDPRFTQSEWDGMEEYERELFKSNAPIDKAPRETVAAPVSAPPPPSAEGLLHKRPTATVTPISGVCSNLPGCPLPPTRSGIEDLPPSPVRVDEVSQSKRKKKSSVRKFSAKSRASSGSKQSMMGVCRCLDKDLGSMSRSGPASASPMARSPSIWSPTSMTRKGRRVHDAGESVMVRTERLAATKDLPPSGNNHGPIPPLP